MVWALCAMMLLAAFAALTTVLFWIRQEAAQGNYFIVPSAWLVSGALATFGFFWLASAWNVPFLAGTKRGLVLAGLVLAIPLGFAILLRLSWMAPTPMTAIRERDGLKAILAIEPAWDVRSYAIYEPVWGGWAWQRRRDDGFTFWKYPYRGEMKLGLGENGRAVILNPQGHRPPFPDGLTTFPCSPGSPPRCLRHIRTSCEETERPTRSDQIVVACTRTRRTEYQKVEGAF